MTAARARRWLVICGVAGSIGGAACTAARPAVAPVAQVASPVAASQDAASASSASEPAPAVAPAPDPPPAPNAPPASSASAAAAAVNPALTAEPAPLTLPCPEDPGRDQRQLPDDVIRLLELSDAMTVVDLGSGDGYFLCRLSRAVGERGRVVATEITEPLVRDLRKRAEREHLTNVEVVKAPTSDVGIAAGTADRILLVNVWHHLPNRRRYASRVARALSPGGKIVVVDFRPGGGGHGINPERVLAELAAGGITGEVVTEDLPHQYVIVGTLRP